MENFLIGQHSTFCESKYNRDFKQQFWGIEACLLETEEDVSRLIDFKNRDGFNIGIHFPLRSGQWTHRDPQYLSNNDKVRLDSFDYMMREIDYSMKVEPKYILFHYPKPVLLDNHVDWHGWKWRFYDKSEYFYEDECDFNTFRERSNYFFKWLSREAKEKGFSPILELDAIPSYLYKTNLLEELLDLYPDIRLCVDIGRLHIQNKIDEKFDSFRFLDRVVNDVSEVHLWNIKITDEVTHNHYPALPTLAPEDGWADIEKYFRILGKSDRKLKILFEHRSDLIKDFELEECYSWISKLAK